MAEGYLLIRVIAETVAQPVPGVTVRVTGNGVNEVFKADSDGIVGPITLPAPDKVIGLEPGLGKPYYDYTITAEGFGFIGSTVTGVKVYPGITGDQWIYVQNPDEWEPENSAEIDIPDFEVGDYPPKIPEDPYEEPLIGPQVLDKVIIPEFVVVHDGVPTNFSAPNYTVNFKEYIKNVMCSEIYSTWTYETLKANCHVIVSLTLNRIYTEWYKSKGYAYTITSSTAYDQKWIRGQTIQSSVARVVDDYFQVYTTMNGKNYPFFSQYCDGVRVKRANWLSQWGSSSLGEQGYTALQILRYYYGSGINIAWAEQVEGYPYSYPGYTLSQGSCSEDVQIIQNQLNAIRNNYPGIPAISNPNGQYGADTAAAVRTFQSVFGLPVTGVVDYATWYKISYIYVAVKRLAEGDLT